MVKRNRFDAAPQALLLSAGVILSVILISIMVVQFEQARKMADAVSENILMSTEQIKGNSVLQYDGALVKGADVRNFYKRYLEKNGEKEVEKIVIDNGTAYTYNSSGSYALLTDMESNRYVNPVDLYVCTVEQNANGVILGVTFKKK